MVNWATTPKKKFKIKKKCIKKYRICVCMYMVGLGFYVIKIPAEYLKVEIILSQLN